METMRERCRVVGLGIFSHSYHIRTCMPIKHKNTTTRHIGIKLLVFILLGQLVQLDQKSKSVKLSMVRRRMLEIFVLKYEAQYEIENKIKRDWSLRTKSSAFYLMSGCDYLLHYCYFQLPVFLVISFLVVRWWTDLSFRSCWRFNNTLCVCMSF